MGATESYASAQASITLSAEHLPVIFVTWFGLPNSEVIETYATWMVRQAEHARETGNPFVIIGDATAIEGRPSPDLRRQMANALDDVRKAAGDSLLHIFIILDNAMLRTIVRMTTYLIRREVPSRPVQDIEDALLRAFRVLDEAGVARPEGLDPATYRRPAHPLGSS